VTHKIKIICMNYI